MALRSFWLDSISIRTVGNLLGLEGGVWHTRTHFSIRQYY